MSLRLRAFSALLAAAAVVWALAPRGLGSASVGRTSRVASFALFANPRLAGIALVGAGVEQEQGSVVFLYARLGDEPRLIIGNARFRGHDEAEFSDTRVLVPRRTLQAVDLLDGSTSECVVSFQVSRLEVPTQVSGVICGVPFTQREAIAATVERTTRLRDTAGLF